jgi:hypothetical protein
MKNALIAGLFLLWSWTASAQLVAFGIKGGVNRPTGDIDNITVTGENGAIDLGIGEKYWGTQFGAWLRLGGGLFVQPEVLFASTRTDYTLQENNAVQRVLTERYNNLDIPLLVGLKFGPLNVHAGPVGHYFLNSRSELTDIAGYEAKFDKLTWGWTIGGGLGFGRLSADVRYQAGFRNFGSHINIDGQQYEFNQKPGRVVLNLNYRLF